MYRNEREDSGVPVTTPEKAADRAGEYGSVTMESGGSLIHALIIAGQIEGHCEAPAGAKSTKYEQCIPTLVAAEESPVVKGLLVLINTIGGDVEAGLAIAELIAGMKKPTVSLILGGGHSIGVPLAVAAKRSFIVPSATMTLHPVRTNGLVIGVPQSFAYFERMQDRIIDFIVKNSSAKADRIKKLMLSTDEMTTDIGTVLDGTAAVSEGLIDQVGGLGDALAALHAMGDGHKN
ncbi:MAG: ATP-dependent Clp protease proteolytic subunit [Clostridia bacterium]|nr:ATP-dependent Clp protease proteolytic subunit [Clostridia bacterium]MBQ7047991.1 ATP-dependent Clp protease proteolytic subunit [Clostridia bacterium]